MFSTEPLQYAATFQQELCEAKW